MRLLAAAVLVFAALVTANSQSTTPRRLFQSANQSLVFETTHSANGSGVGVVNWTGQGAGMERRIGGLDAYIATPNSTNTSTAAVLVFTDIFGFQVDNTRVWADNLANEGFIVIIPDYFKGNPRRRNDSMDTMAAWFARFPISQVLNETDAVLADINTTFPQVSKLGAVGFCWGGLYSTLLTAGSPPKADAALVYHGSLLTPAEIEAINAPISFQQGDPALDRNFNITFYNEVKAFLDRKRAEGLDTEITYYPNQPHGFAVRGATDPNTTQAATDAFLAGAAFLKKHLLST